jgi:hypothetical protein
MCLITNWHCHLAMTVKAWMASQRVLQATSINTAAKATTKNNNPKARTMTTATAVTTTTDTRDNDIVSTNYMQRLNTSHHYSHFTERHHIHTVHLTKTK